QPYEVLEFQPMRKAQDVTVAQTKIKNLLTGKIIERSFHKGDTLEEADMEKFQAKFIYGHREKYVFSDANNPANRFELAKEQIGDSIQFLKQNEIVDGLKFKGEIVNIVLPVKVQLKVKDAPPGIKGNTAQGGTKAVTLETGAIIQVPLFVETDDIVEVNTETGEYAKRVSHL
ncbi:MAG: elongation factor P, partial [Candidatus Wildermuthbacteria bacterium]|nr:elongation factor P [Candidatus Wildermuthbacteria bacterium]